MDSVDPGTTETTTKGTEMVQTVEAQPEAAQSVDLLDDVRDAAKAGQHATAEALRAFRQSLDEAIPEAVQPLRTKIVAAAIELADKLVDAQYDLNRNLIRSADRALGKSGGD
ncbi:hypothetical protein AB0K11_04325 [Mycobacterium sp. NPDC050551]|uniref:hypothetical protein n=1 Tax=Mycobacterium sp. NPDC050551 TaxID=3155407 RepID=UPI003416B1DE